GIRHRLYTRAADRDVHGLLRRRLRRVLQLRPLCPRARGGVMAEPALLSGREQKILGIIETTRAKRPKLRDEHITMAHGAGGLATDELRAEVQAIAAAAAAAGVAVVTGDTKVVERGHADGMYICTAGIGHRDPRARLSPRALRPGDRILLSGQIGDHGTAIMLARGEFDLDAEVESDTRSLWPAVDAMLQATGPELRCIRDATRGGVASVLNELARASAVAMIVREGDVPVRPEV